MKRMSLLPLPEPRTAAAALSAAAACACALAGGAAAVEPAFAATISPQSELRAPRTFPVDMFGGYRQGQRIPRGFVLLRRSVELAPGERRAETTFRCPGGRRVRSLALNDPSDIGFVVPSDQAKYTRRSTLRLQLFPSPDARRENRPARGRAYVLCRPRG